LEADFYIWRPILEGKCSLEAVLSGLVTIDDILKLNALMDAMDAYKGYANEQASKKKG